MQSLTCLGRAFQREGKLWAPGLVLGPEWYKEEADIRGAEAVEGSVIVAQLGEVEGAC